MQSVEVGYRSKRKICFARTSSVKSLKTPPLVPFAHSEQQIIKYTDFSALVRSCGTRHGYEKCTRKKIASIREVMRNWNDSLQVPVDKSMDQGHASAYRHLGLRLSQRYRGIRMSELGGSQSQTLSDWLRKSWRNSRRRFRSSLRNEDSV